MIRNALRVKIRPTVQVVDRLAQFAYPLAKFFPDSGIVSLELGVTVVAIMGAFPGPKTGGERNFR